MITPKQQIVEVFNVAGIIPAEISHLSKLHILSIESDPYEIRFEPQNFELLLKNLTRLRELHLSSVNISSTSPLKFSSYLTNLGLSDTQIFGTLPEGVYNLSNLESLDLSDNPQFTVRFPTTKWNSSASLMKLYLSGVNATGRTPESFGHLTSLHRLRIASCNLSGSIPKPLWNLTNIEVSDLGILDLSDNHLSGNIQEFYFEPLYPVALKQNQLQGPIPKSLLDLQGLQFLLLSRNNLSGQIASTICNLTKLLVLDLGSNNLEGPIPLCLGEMSGL
ncbi:hypothetical protein RDI58_027024 [Solanum bulbocastanum]|uniref:Uncharacterized protein n=1 Tax=Solanum bulbocastanum TaxID=147425 RepID=A0AAN8Y3X3_SOLBU